MLDATSYCIHVVQKTYLNKSIHHYFKNVVFTKNLMNMFNYNTWKYINRVLKMRTTMRMTKKKKIMKKKKKKMIEKVYGEEEEEEEEEDD